MEVSEANWVKVALSVEDGIEIGTLVGLTTFSLAEGVGFKRENKNIKLLQWNHTARSLHHTLKF